MFIHLHKCVSMFIIKNIGLVLNRGIAGHSKSFD